MALTSDPFRRKRPGVGEQSYPGQNGLNYLMEKMLPHLLIRTDPRVPCLCQDPLRKTGDLYCSNCFGTGRQVVSLDRIGAYITDNASRNAGYSDEQGRKDIGSRKIYTGRWVAPSRGDLILQVGWDVPLRRIYSVGKPTVIYNSFEVRDVHYGTATQVTYIEITTALTNHTKEELEDVLLRGSSLPPYKNCLSK